MLSNKNLMKHKKKKGFSLLEIVVSLGLVVLFIIPVANMVLGTIKITKSSENKQQAIAVLQEAVELIKLEKQDFPTKENKYIDINGKYRVTRINGDIEIGEFKVGSLNENQYGFEVIGAISEVEKIGKDPTVSINEAVDGAIYLSEEDEGETTSQKSLYIIKLSAVKDNNNIENIDLSFIK